MMMSSPTIRFRRPRPRAASLGHGDAAGGRRCRAALPGSRGRRRGRGRIPRRRSRPCAAGRRRRRRLRPAGRMASCSADISSEKKATTPPRTVFFEPSGCGSQAVLLGDVEGDVAGEPDVFPIDGRAARITRSEGCRPPIFWSRSIRPVERPARPPSRLCASAAMVTAPCRASEKLTKPCDGPAGLGQGEELLFGPLDLVAGGELGGRPCAASVGDVAADADQVAAQRQVVDRPGVVRRIGGRRGAVHQVGEIAHAAQFVEAGSRENCSASRIGSASWPLRMWLSMDANSRWWNGSKKCSRLQVVADPLEGGVCRRAARPAVPVSRLDVGRDVGDRHIVGNGAQIEGGNESHGLSIA